MVFIGKVIRLEGKEVGRIQPLSFYLKGSEKLYKKIKKIVPFILVAVLVSSFVMTNYNKAREVKAVAGVDDLAVAGLVTTLLLAYGYVTTQYYNNTDGANALADEWEEEYNQARLTVINGGGGSDNGDDDDDKNKFEDTDGDGKITEKDIPPFSNFLTKNAVTLSANASLILTPIVSKFISNLYGGNDITNQSKIEMLSSLTSLADDYISTNNLDISSYKYLYKIYDVSTNYKGTSYSVYQYYSNDAKVLIDANKTGGWGYRFSCGKFIEIISYCKSDGTKGCTYKVNDSGLGSSSKVAPTYYFFNGPVFYNYEDFTNGGSRVDWVTPELQDTFDNKGNLELLPSFNPLASYSMASQQALQELLSNLASSSLSPVQQLDLVNKFIAGLKTSETPDPSPNPDPSPEPNPNPDPSNPDNGSDGDSSGDSDIDKGSFVRDLKTLFPFCIPFDLIDCIRLFNAEPVTPKLELPIHFPIVNVDYTFTIDLKDFDGVAKICRSMFMILFIIGLVLATRPLIRG